MTPNYLSIIEHPDEWGMSGETLVVFPTEPVRPPALLVNPAVVGFAAATGVWHLKVWHEESRRAFYTKDVPTLEHPDGADPA